MQLIAKPLENM